MLSLAPGLIRAAICYSFPAGGEGFANRRASARERRLSVRFFGTEKNGGDGYGHGLAVEGEDHPVNSHAFPVAALPFRAFERNHIPGHGIGFHLVDGALDLRLPVAGKLLQLLDGRRRKLSGPVHLSPSARIKSVRL